MAALLDFVGCLSRRSGPRLTVEEINRIADPGMGQTKMKITADTNVLIRAAVQDDPHQARKATTGPAGGRFVAVPVPVLCEFVWVLRRGYKKSASEVSAAIRRLTKSVNVVVNWPAIEAGLAVLDAGGDFADGVIAYEGNWLGAEELVSFDANAVSLLQSQNVRARLL